MNAASKRQRQRDSFAVTRCYHPTRIERELLTQIFDLVQRSSAVDSSDTVFDQRRGAAAWKDEEGLLLREQRHSHPAEQQPSELEPAV